MSIEKLLQATIKAGGHELRLIPGRRIVIVTAAGEKEVQSPAQTQEGVDQVLAPILTPAARQGLAAGRAEWRLQLPAVGTVRARAEVRRGVTEASFAVGEGASSVSAAAAP
ncbi:MAG TPA: hypothetical protein VMR21_01300, partial [Vicinamibacteria bacterium]|nr:hypothetical protein [Vicinamibacteria bacterium]